MARLPTPGSDSGTWGDILNEFLTQALKSDGTIKDNAVTANTIAPNAMTSSKIASDAIGATAIADGSITEALLDTALQTKVNASSNQGVTSVAGKTGVVTLDKSDVGLSNVDNTADTAKPVSTAVQSALDAKANSSHTHTASQISDASAAGLSVLTAANAAAARTAIGAGTGSGDVTLNGAQVLTNKDLTTGNTFPTLNQNTPGSAATLASTRTFQTDLGSTATASFNGSADVTPGITGTLGVAHGGTGRVTASTAYGLIAAGTTATGVQQTIAPGVSGQFLKSAGSSSLASFADIQLADLSDVSSVVTLTDTQILTTKRSLTPR